MEIIEARFQYQTGLMPEAITYEPPASSVAVHLLDQSFEQQSSRSKFMIIAENLTYRALENKGNQNPWKQIQN